VFAFVCVCVCLCVLTSIELLLLNLEYSIRVVLRVIADLSNLDFALDLDSSQNDTLSILSSPTGPPLK